MHPRARPVRELLEDPQHDLTRQRRVRQQQDGQSQERVPLPEDRAGTGQRRARYDRVEPVVVDGAGQPEEDREVQVPVQHPTERRVSSSARLRELESAQPDQLVGAELAEQARVLRRAVPFDRGGQVEGYGRALTRLEPDRPGNLDPDPLAVGRLDRLALAQTPRLPHPRHRSALAVAAGQHGEGGQPRLAAQLEDEAIPASSAATRLEPVSGRLLATRRTPQRHSPPNPTSMVFGSAPRFSTSIR